MKLRLTLRGLLLCSVWGVGCSLSHNPDLPSFIPGDGDSGDGDVNPGDGDGVGDGDGDGDSAASGGSHPSGGASLGGADPITTVEPGLGGGGSSP